MPTKQKKEKPSSPQLSLLVDTTNPHKVLEEVEIIFLEMFSTGDFTLLSTVFEDIIALFSGNFQGFKASDTPYHNLRHTTDVFLAMARLIHGAHIEGVVLSAMDASMGLVAALMHDVGYIQKDSENYDSSAKLASVHVDRSIEFMAHLLTQKGSSQDSILLGKQAIFCTDLEKPLTSIPFTSPSGKLIGKMLASADLLAQTADRTYLEKLPSLFFEFKESGNVNYEHELDLIKDSIVFNDRMHARLTYQLGNVNRFLQNHFQERWNIDAHLYHEAIDRAMTYLAHMLEFDAENYRIHFRRSLS